MRKMVRMKIRTEEVELTKYPLLIMRIYEDPDNLPLPLIQLSHKYSLSLYTYMREVEVVVEELWREEWRSQSISQYKDLHPDGFNKTQPRCLPYIQVIQSKLKIIS